MQAGTRVVEDPGHVADLRSVSSPAGCGHGGRGAGEKAGAMEKAGEKWPRVVPLSTAGLNPMSTGLAGNRRDEGLAQSASSQHFCRDPTCQMRSKQVVDIDSASPPALQGGCCCSFPVEGAPREGTDCQDTEPARRLWTEQLRVWGHVLGLHVGREGGEGTGAGCGARACLGGPGLGAATWGEREGLDPSVPSPETLRESDSQGKSQGFCMLIVDSLFPKTQEG